jgi:hypothetical protein
VLALAASCVLVAAVAPKSPGGAPQASETSSPTLVAVESATPDSSTSHEPTPRPTIDVWTMPPDAPRTRISLGPHHACFVLTNGTVKCWGRNVYGELGDGTLTDSTVPVTAANISRARSVVTGRNTQGRTSCALIADGTIWCWGGTLSMPLPERGFEHVSALFAGDTGSCYATSDGQLVNCVPGSQAKGIDPSAASAIAVGAKSTCVLVEGAVDCWLAFGGSSQAPGPMGARIGGISGATAISNADTQACAIVPGGAVKCWDTFERYGESPPTAYTIEDVSGATAIASGNAFGCAIVARGSVKCWGDNSHGQLGQGHAEKSSGGGVDTTPYTVGGISGATAIAAGGDTVCVVLSGDDVRCWGGNDDGNLGTGDTRSCSLPVGVSGLSRASSKCAAVSKPRPD